MLLVWFALIKAFLMVVTLPVKKGFSDFLFSFFFTVQIIIASALIPTLGVISLQNQQVLKPIKLLLYTNKAKQS